MPPVNYKTVTLPLILVDEVDRLVHHPDSFYQSRQDFIKNAIRKELLKNNHQKIRAAMPQPEV